MAYKYTIGQPFIYRRTAELRPEFPDMCFAVPCEEYKINPVLADALDKISSCMRPRAERLDSTVRIAGSPAPILRLHCRGIACLWARRMAAQRSRALQCWPTSSTVDKIPDFIKRVKDKNSKSSPDGFRAPRLQELRSPRQRYAEDVSRVLAETGHNDNPMLKVALELGKDRAQRSVFH